MVHFGSLDCSARAAALYREAELYLCHARGERTIFHNLESGASVHLHINARNDDSYDSATHVLHWDPHSALRTSSGGRQTPALGLAHEAAHATAPPARLLRDWNLPDERYDDAEERRVIRGSEARAARALGESQRYDHAGHVYRVATPVSR